MDLNKYCENSGDGQAKQTSSSPTKTPPTLELTVLIPALREAPNLAILLPQLRDLLRDLEISNEIMVVTLDTDEETIEVTGRNGARLVEQEGRGYGKALSTGFDAAQGKFILTMDADLSHQPVFIRDLWARRSESEIVIASRYVKNGSASMPASRYYLSRVLNNFFAFGLRIPVKDLSSGFRLYRGELVKGQNYAAKDFDILPEILVLAYTNGWKIAEVPFRYAPRKHGSSNARVIPFGIAYLRTFRKLWKLRNANSKPTPTP